ncbi:hypothetical protein quinque_008414 [Culex quinquefasciatus]
MQQPGRDRRFSDYPTAATASPPIAAKRKHRMNPSAGTVDGEQDKAAQTTNNPPSEAQKSQNNPAPKSWSFSKAKKKLDVAIMSILPDADKVPEVKKKASPVPNFQISGNDTTTSGLEIQKPLIVRHCAVSVFTK